MGCECEEDDDVCFEFLEEYMFFFFCWFDFFYDGELFDFLRLVVKFCSVVFNLCFFCFGSL